jgi:hypothetical protein
MLYNKSSPDYSHLQKKDRPHKCGVYYQLGIIHVL